MSLIKCTSLSLGYGGKRIVDDLTFTVNEGDFLFIVGENGSGKSTLIKALLSLNAPVSGRIEYSDSLRKNEIGYLPQVTAVQRDFPASVYEVVLSGCLNTSSLSPFYSRAQKERAKKNMELLGIYALKSRRFGELSGGQQQRVLLARALCATSRLLLLDEPTTALDPDVTRELYSIIADLNRMGLTVIMVSHDLDAALLHATHILHVARKPKFFGRIDDYKKSDAGSAFLLGGGRDA